MIRMLNPTTVASPASALQGKFLLQASWLAEIEVIAARVAQ